VAELDKYIVGQDNAKKAVAIAMRNRWRRQQVGDELRDEILPSNLILIGPTGVGKTEVARRLARLAGAPFVKVEASKFTEVGYVGRDVESMIRDLVDGSVNMVRVEREDEVEAEAEARVEERLLDLLLPPLPPSRPDRGVRPVPGEGAGEGDSPDPTAGPDGPQGRPTVFVMGPSGVSTEDPDLLTLPNSGAPGSDGAGNDAGLEDDGAGFGGPDGTADGGDAAVDARRARTREKLRKLQKDGKLDDRQVELDVTQSTNLEGMMLPMGGFDGMDHNFTEMLQDILPRKTKRRTVSVGEARRILVVEELDRLIDMDEVVNEALGRAEEMGIVFLDEIDKIAGERGGAGPDVSREGVQRDLLPIVEGSNVQTKYGMVRTDHVLFVAAGAFHVAKPSDLIPELQGRFPIRVELESLGEAEFVRILQEPKNALIHQYSALAASEGCTLVFHAKGIAEIARIASELNERMENIGARRLQTVLTTLLEDVLFELPEEGTGTLEIDGDFVVERLKKVAEDEDLRSYIL